MTITQEIDMSSVSVLVHNDKILHICLHDIVNLDLGKWRKVKGIKSLVRTIKIDTVNDGTHQISLFKYPTELE